jgi:predicted Zn-dependent protease
LLDHEAARRAAAPALEDPRPDGVEVVTFASRAGLTRFASSQIVQSTERNEISLSVGVRIGTRSAAASTTLLDPGGAQAAVDRALEAAQVAPEDPDTPELADPSIVGRAPGLMRFDEATALCSPQERAAAASEMISAAGIGDVAGFFSSGSYAYGVFNSKGIDCFDCFTRCAAAALVDTGDATGWSEASSAGLAGVDRAEIAYRAGVKADSGRPAVMAPDEYPVVLEPAAVAELLSYLSYAGFGAKQVIEGESFLSAGAGGRIGPPFVTVADDTAHPLSIGIGFDFEGVPRTRVAVIDKGVATGPVTDLRTASQLSTHSTGHASGSREFGPYAANIVMDPGESSLEDLIGRIDEGVLVTRFHYVNVLDRPSALLTGMTRDGTFRISGGEVAEPVRNLRFTQSALDLLAQVISIGEKPEVISTDDGFGSTVAPAVAAAGFRFTSSTTH